MSNPTWCGKISYCYAQDLNGFCEDNCKTSCNKYKEPVKEPLNPKWCDLKEECKIKGINKTGGEPWCVEQCGYYHKPETKTVIIPEDEIQQVGYAMPTAGIYGVKWENIKSIEMKVEI